MESEERRALASFCRELAELREECAQQPGHLQQLLDRIETEARARRPVVGLLAELLSTGRDDALRTLAIGLPGTGPGQADEEQFRCPDGACDRIAGTVPAGRVPNCLVTGQPMKRR
jgi:hypothetical protein